MTEQTRAHLKQEFQDGERPSGADFADLLDSSLNKQDDGLSIDPIDSTLVLARGLRLGNSADNQAGTLRFNGGVPEYHDGANFVPIGGAGSGGAFQAVGAGPDVAYTGGGTVGIGNFGAVASTYRFEVELGNNTGTDQQVRLGTAVICRGTGTQAGSAFFSHADHANNNNFAVRQRATGEVSVNAPNNAPIFFSQGGSVANTRMTISANGRVLIGTPVEIVGPAAVLHVGGDAIKSTPGGAWLSGSDERIKEDVEDYAPGLEQILAVRPVTFRYNGKAGSMKGARGVGVIAQEIERVLPETVTKARGILDKNVGEVDDLRFFDSSSLTYALINAVKELTARVEVLETALEAKSNGGIK
jgi:hypothetical protein